MKGADDYKKIYDDSAFCNNFSYLVHKGPAVRSKHLDDDDDTSYEEKVCRECIYFVNKYIQVYLIYSKVCK